MADDFTAQVKKVAMAMGASLSDQDIGRIPREVRMQGNFNYNRFLEYMRQFKTSEQQEESIRSTFKMLDKDGSGYIEWNEMKYILSSAPNTVPLVPLSDEEAEALIQVADTDGDGRIDFKEFSDMVKMEKKPRK
ncbi:parvalbumin-like EF-hand-containing protein [Clupea harengus]|uniref:Parvalbumin n=1 Tax=Clupea harengus TaxID=7950 RepID=A0A6P8EY50_CLUHA|nr:parvalbumin-like EF-hand-containing protein [Clupea harengus]